MRAAVIFGLGCSPNDLKPFQNKRAGRNDIEWRTGMPAVSGEADVILLFGGDGTIHRHLGPLVKLGLPVLIVPSGSGNDFARALNLRSVHDSLAAWNAYCSGNGNIRSIDLGVITPLEVAHGAASHPASSAPNDLARASGLGARYFCSVAGVGLDAEIARRANHLPRWLRAHGGYALSFPAAMFRFAPFPMKILTPEAPNPTKDCHPDRSVSFPQGTRRGVEGPGVPPHQPDPTKHSSPAARWEVKKAQPTILAAFANTSTYGGGMKIAPRAQMDDGLLDVCVIGAVDPFKLFCMFPTVYFGRHLTIREVDYFSAARLRVETEHPLDLYADGEYVCRTPMEISVERDALQVICLP